MFGGLSTYANPSSSSPERIRSDRAWANYYPGTTDWPNPSTGGTAYGTPVAIIENQGTQADPDLVITFP